MVVIAIVDLCRMPAIKCGSVYACRCVRSNSRIEVKVTDKVDSDAHLDFELSEHLPYLFKHIYSQLEVASAGALSAFGINVAIWRILAVLWQHDDLSHRELSELTSIEVSTLSRISKSVQRQGLIRRKRTQQDQRTVRVTLTDKGRDIVKQAIPSARGVQNDIIGDLPPQDVATLTRILHVIVENLNRYSLADNLESDAQTKVATLRKPSTATKTTRAPSLALTRRKRAPAP